MTQPLVCTIKGKERDCKGIQSKREDGDLKKRKKVKAYQHIKVGSSDLDMKLAIESSVYLGCSAAERPCKHFENKCFQDAHLYFIFVIIFAFKPTPTKPVGESFIYSPLLLCIQTHTTNLCCLPFYVFVFASFKR